MKTLFLFFIIVVFGLNIIPISTGLLGCHFNYSFAEGYSFGWILIGLYMLKRELSSI